MISLNVSETASALNAKFIITPTETGATARRIARFKPEGWIIASNPKKSICDFSLLFLWSSSHRYGNGSHRVV